MTKLDVYDKKQMAEAHELCENYDFTKESEGRINIMREDCIAHIMEYAGYGSDMIREALHCAAVPGAAGYDVYRQ